MTESYLILKELQDKILLKKIIHASLVRLFQLEDKATFVKYLKEMLEDLENE